MKKIILILSLFIACAFAFGQKTISQFPNAAPTASTLFLVENPGVPTNVYNNLTIQQLASYIALSGNLGDTIKIFVLASPDSTRITVVDSLFLGYVKAGQLVLEDSFTIDGFRAYSAVGSDGAGFVLNESATEYVTAWSKDGSLYLNVSNGKFAEAGAQYIFSVTGLAVTGNVSATTVTVGDSTLSSATKGDTIATKEYVDLQGDTAQNDFTFKGEIFIQNPVDSVGEYALTLNPNTGRVFAKELTHGFFAFDDSSRSLSLSSNATWYKVSANATGIFDTIEDEGIYLDNDTITLGHLGHYQFHYHIVGIGATGVFYKARLYNVTQATPIPISTVQTGQGAGNRISVGNTAYCNFCNAGDEIILQMQAESNTQTFTLIDGSILILMTHGE